MKYWPRRTGCERRDNVNNESFSRFWDRYVRYNHNVDAAMRKYRRNSTYTDNDTTQWRSRDAWQRLTPTTTATTHGRIGVGGPLKRRIVRFEKNDWFRFNKSGLVRFNKSGLFRFQKKSFVRFKKNGLFAFKKAFWSLWKKRFFFDGRLRVTRSEASTRIGGSPM